MARNDISVLMISEPLGTVLNGTEVCHSEPSQCHSNKTILSKDLWIDIYARMFSHDNYFAIWLWKLFWDGKRIAIQNTKTYNGWQKLEQYLPSESAKHMIDGRNL